MRPIIPTLTLAASLLAASASLTGCVVASPRPVHRAYVVAPVGVRVWVPGYWAPRHRWVRGYWRYR